MSQATLAIREFPATPEPLPATTWSATIRFANWSTRRPASAAKPVKWPASSGTAIPFTDTVFDNSYQTMPETAWNYWNLIKFNEHEREDGSVTLLMRKDQCMHCADPGCLAACPADGAIVQYTNGIVDFQQENCIGCGYCVSGCPFDIPKFNPDDQEDVQVHALR